MAQSKTGIVLMHGAGMGKWIWRDIEPLLQFPYIMPDRYDKTSGLPVSKVTISQCIDYTASEINSSGFEKAVLVAHSGSGVIAGQVAAAAKGKVKEVVYLAANIPPAGKSALDMLPLMPRIMNFVMILLMSRGMKLPQKQFENIGRNVFCNDCSEEIIQYVISNNFIAEPPAVAFYRVQKADMSGIRRTYIRTLKDKTLSPEKQEKMAQMVGCDNIIDIDTGHMPMLSRPAEFAAILNGIAGNQ